MERKKALVLGATGGIGSEVAARLHTAGWSVTALHRNPDGGGKDARFAWTRGDATVRDDVVAAADGASLIVHAVNPPGYRDWERLVLPMLDNSLAAARATGARILLPGTVYNYGPEVFPNVTEDAPQTPRTRKGRIRAEMELRLMEAAWRGDARALIVRAGDFFGPSAANNWLSQGIVTPGGRPKVITYPGRPGVGHQWAYLPDVAETMVRLVEQESLTDLATFHMDGHWDPDGRSMVEAIQRFYGAPEIPVRRMPWFLMGLAAPFVPLMSELSEVRYLWETPVRLANDRLLATLGEEPRTPLDEALAKTLGALRDRRA